MKIKDRGVIVCFILDIIIGYLWLIVFLIFWWKVIGLEK